MKVVDNDQRVLAYAEPPTHFSSVGLYRSGITGYAFARICWQRSTDHIWKVFRVNPGNTAARVTSDEWQPGLSSLTEIGAIVFSEISAEFFDNDCEKRATAGYDGTVLLEGESLPTATVIAEDGDNFPDCMKVMAAVGLVAVFCETQVNAEAA